jgi:hypothetical protein
VRAFACWGTLEGSAGSVLGPELREVLIHGVLRLAAATGIVLGLAACGGRSSDAHCRSEPRSDQLTCEDAVTLALNVAAVDSVRSAQGRVVAYLDRMGVSEGHSVPAWFVTFTEPLLQEGKSECPSTEFTVVLDAGGGRLLANDIPGCLRR